MHPHAHASHDGGQKHLPRLIAWEVTRSCMLACKHCRAAARREPYAGELSTEDCFRLLDNIASFARPIMILTGGEPMLRKDIYDIASYAHGLGLPVVMAPCGALINDESAARIIAAGISRISISIDGATAESHDAFRGVAGAFESAISGIEAAKRTGLDFQINTTVTMHNLAELPEILDLAVSLGASVFNPFMLVPTGRGTDLIDQEISPVEYEKTLRWLGEQEGRDDIKIRVTCGPHYQRIVRQMDIFHDGMPPAKGCMGGQSFAFISHRGDVQICGFLDIKCGDVREAGFDFRKIWETSDVFLKLRDPASYHGKCGQCEYASVCGGCRARAYAMTGDYLGAEPFCLYKPKQRQEAMEAAETQPREELGELGELGELDELDEKILSIIQTDFPVAAQPFEELARRLGADAEQILEKITRMRSGGLIRRLGAVFDSRSLGYASTLVAARIPPESLEDVAGIVSALPGVTHNYRRDHAYNLWFTLTAESEAKIDEIIEGLRGRSGVEDFFSLPALAVYKIRVDFQFGDNGESQGSPAGDRKSSPQRNPADFDDMQRAIVRVLQEDIPLGPEPFADLASQLGCSPERLLGQIDDWKRTGVIRRFGAVVNHRQAGFRANGMAVFHVDDERIDNVGRRLAEYKEVSHCYCRPPLLGFDYTLFAMVHGRSERQVETTVAGIAQRLGLSDYKVLFSTAEFKKTSMKYFCRP